MVIARGRAGVGAAQEACDFFEGALSGREADTLRRPLASRRQAFEGNGQVGAALGGQERVDLVDDDGVNAFKRPAAVRREQEVERLGGRDQDVGRMAEKPGALGRRRVTGADGDRGHDVRRARLLGRAGDQLERHPQIAFDIEGEGLER